MPDALTLKTYLAELDVILSPLNEEQLRTVLTGYATGLPASARPGFLEDLRNLCTPQPGAQPKDDDLVSDVESFIEDVQTGMYYDSWGWDPELRRERAFGDESWVPRMDALFDRAATVFLAGRHDLSAQAYGLLFGALALEGVEGSLFSYESSPDESLTTDLGEAGARWLRSLYEIAADPAEAAARMADCWLVRLPYGSRPDSLLAVREALPADFARLDDFWGCWARALVERAGGYDTLRSALLREVAEAAGDLDVLAEAARREGQGQPFAYLDLANALHDRGDAEVALGKCVEGLGLLYEGDQDQWTVRQWAPLADKAAELAEKEESVRFRITAFMLAASTRRLVMLHRASEAHRPGSGGEAAGEAADRLAAKVPGFTRYWLASFRAQALLLAGRVDDALKSLPDSGDVVGESADTTLTVVPYVLAACSGAVAHRDWERTVLRTLLAKTVDADRAVFDDDQPDGDDGALALLLERALREQGGTAAERAGWRSVTRGAVDRWVRSVLGGKQRSRYGDAARLAVAVTEAEIIIDGESGYLDGVLDSYRRYVAFRREADEVRRGSVLL